jgi:ferritin-like metal-binding protein YciE
MKEIADLNDLMVEQLRDLYHGETDLHGLLTKIVKSTHEPRLKQIIDDYRVDNESQVMRLRQVFELLFLQKRGETCQAMKAMIKEANDIIMRSSSPDVRDAGLITALQHTIHYKMAGYGAVCTYAKVLERFDIGRIMYINLEKEKKADRRLAVLAEEVINERAIREVTIYRSFEMIKYGSLIDTNKRKEIASLR